MNTKTKRRLVIATGLIVVIVVAVLAVAGGIGAARGITVAQALDGTHDGERVQVTGAVADGSYKFSDDGMTFAIRDAQDPVGGALQVRYRGAASSTFGNGVTAICTGVLSSEGADVVLDASEMVTQCPSKYESATDALSVKRLLDYGEEIVGATVKVTGSVCAGSVAAVDAESERLVLLDAEDGATALPVAFGGALPEGIADGASVVVTGSLSADGSFLAADVALEG